MSVSLKGAGTADTSFPLNPSWGVSAGAGDISILIISWVYYGTVTAPDTPAGWTLFGQQTIVEPGENPQYTLLINAYKKTGTGSGSLGNITWTFGDPDSGSGSATIDVYQCGGSETIDPNLVAATGKDAVYGTTISFTANAGGTNGTGRLDPGPGDLIVGTFIAHNGAQSSVNMACGSGATCGSQSNDHNFAMAGVYGEVTGASRPVTAAAAPYGSPSYSANTSINSIGGGIFFRITVNEKTSSDVRTASDATFSSGLMDGDTSAGVESAGTIRTGVTVPYPKRWTANEIPTADNPAKVTDLNVNWRDTFRWLLGYTIPAFSGTSTDTSNWTVSTWYAIPMNTENVKQGGMIHASNDTKIYVPEDGWYRGFYGVARDSTGAGTTAKWVPSVWKNGVQTQLVSMDYMTPMNTDLDAVTNGVPFSVYLLAGDYLELRVYDFASAGTVKNISGQSWIEFVWTNK